MWRIILSCISVLALIMMGSKGGCGGSTECEYHGTTYKDGASFPSADGCNTCSCKDGQVACSLKACVKNCQYAGKEYKDGERFPASDGCNTCVCSNGNITACTLVVCDKTCQYEGKEYKEGEQFPASDGCNTCYCSNGNAVCTLKACVKNCIYEGKEYKDGERFPASDGCNTCTCSNGNIACTEMACAKNCIYEGKEYKDGESFPASDGCNTCSCSNGNVTCTLRACAKTCMYEGKEYKDGESFPASDGCNTCICSNGVVGCTKKACPSTCQYEDKEYKEGESFPASDGCNTCSCKSGHVICTLKACNVCGGKSGATCARGEFCHYPNGHCGIGEQTGHCKQSPSACTDHYDPVCGCDDKTHSNECYAHSAGISVKYKGECAAQGCMYEGQSYKDGESFPASDGCNTCTCVNGRVGCTKIACPPKLSCGSRGLAPCPQDYYCNQPGHCGATDIPGVCELKAQACTQQYDPVCGCDDKTYGNACSAASAGVSVKFQGECKTKTCTHNGQTYKDGESFPAGDGCNTCTCVNGMVGCTKIGCQPKMCGGIAGIMCARGEFCNYPNGHCGSGDQTGSCQAIPTTCTFQYDPVCGCDDKTYGNECTAHAAGVSVKYKGECKAKTCTHNGQTYKDGESFPAGDGCNTCICSNGQVGCTKIACPPKISCGSRGMAPCPQDQYCNQPGHCGAADVPGFCEPKPQGCAAIYDPVCGCDGKTHSNACMAASVGVSVKYKGPCK